MNITNITSILPTTLQTQQTEYYLIYVIMSVQLLLFILIFALNELVKYHILDPARTKLIIDTLTDLLNNVRNNNLV